MWQWLSIGVALSTSIGLTERRFEVQLSSTYISRFERIVRCCHLKEHSVGVIGLVITWSNNH